MSKQKKFLMFYSVLLFSAALLLILISALSQSRLSPSDSVSQKDEQQAFNQTIQKSVTELIKENENLRTQLKDEKEKGAQLKEQTAAQDEQCSQHRFEAEAAEFLIEAEMFFNVGDYEKSRDCLQNVNAHILSPKGIQLYDWLKEKLAKKGFKLQGE